MDMISQIRQFNRTVTHQIGVLQNHFLGRNRSLGSSRLLFEIDSGGIEIRELRARLDLDSGYTSRLLRGLESEGLVKIRSSPNDSRVRSISLTTAGLKEVEILNSLSDIAAASILQPLNIRQQVELTNAMATVERLLRASAVTIRVENPSSHLALECLGHYFQELAQRFDDGFDPSQSISAATEELSPPQGFFIIAKLHGQAVGCGALKCHPDFGELKRMWVAPTTRGLGIGKRILFHLEGIARKQNLSLIRLETNKALKEAQGLYRSSGFIEVAPFNDETYAHHWFEKKL